MIPTPTEIAAWANKRDAQGLMPILLRRLIHGSVPTIRSISFPGGDSVQLGGFDGELDVDLGNAWVPEGKSVWECGCNRRVKGKADSDYEKRTKKVKAKERRERTFVFVTPRRWSAKNTWAQLRRDENKWKDVRCLDADDIEQWAERTLPAAFWLAEQIGLASSGFVTAQRYWDTWANACSPTLSFELVLAGRSHEVCKLIELLQLSPGRSMTIAADSREEALAFVCAALSGDDGRGLADRLLIADAFSPIERLNDSPNAILAVESDVLERRLGVLGGKIHVIIPRSRGEATESADIELGSIRSDAFDNCLKSIGLSEDEVTAVARKSGRSLPILRRRWAISPGLRQPLWSGDTDTAHKFIPFALCGAWAADREGDISVLAGISGRDQKTIERDLADLLAMDDSPMEAIGSVNRVLSPIDAIFAIGGRLTRSDLDGYFDFVERVYSVRDPALDLDESKRWMANVLGKQHPFSGTLFHGLGNTLILLAIYGDNICGKRLCINISGRVYAIVRKLLTDLNSDQWLSIRGTLLLLAEAAPKAFLEAIEQDLAKTSPPILSLMRVIEGGISGACLRTELLWALELIAWNPKNFIRVTQILAQLSRNPITDNWGNKPSSSLLSLFRAWLPKTAVPIDNRIAALQHIYTKFPDVGFNLSVSLVDNRMDSAMDNARPRWRDDAADSGRSVTQGEYVQMVHAAADLLVARVPQSVSEIQELIIHHSVFLPDYTIKLWELIEAWIDSSPNDEDKAAVRETIRRYVPIWRGRKIKAVNDAVPAQKAFERLLPNDLTARHRWLFESNWIEVSADELDGKINYELRQSKLNEVRTAALFEIWQTNGLAGIIDFTCAMKSPYLIGVMLTGNPPEGFSVREVMDCALSHAQEEQANAFIGGILSAQKIEDLTSLLEESLCALREGKQDERKTLRIIRSAPTQHATWKVLATAPPEIITQYWETAPIGWGHWSSDEIEFLVKSLLDARRPKTAFHAAHLDLKNLNSESIVRLLEAISSVDEPNIAMPQSYDIEGAFERLYKNADIDRGRIARLEFVFAPALVHGKRGPAALNEELGKDPKLFVQMISYMYRRDDNGADPEEWKIENPDAAKNAARLCHDVLHYWHRLPGLLADGSIDPAILKEWVTQCRRLCLEHGRKAVGDITIGHHLAYAPADADGTWPCLPVREIIEESGTEDIFQGLHTGVFNKRGVTSRSMYEGGAQERAIAEQYDNYAKAVEAKWPRTAAMLREISDGYRRDAEYHDRHTLLNDRSDL